MDDRTNATEGAPGDSLSAVVGMVAQELTTLSRTVTANALMPETMKKLGEGLYALGAIVAPSAWARAIPGLLSDPPGSDTPGGSPTPDPSPYLAGHLALIGSNQTHGPFGLNMTTAGGTAHSTLPMPLAPPPPLDPPVPMPMPVPMAPPLPTPMPPPLPINLPPVPPMPMTLPQVPPPPVPLAPPPPQLSLSPPPRLPCHCLHPYGDMLLGRPHEAQSPQRQAKCHRSLP